ncbi:MAG: O-antigen ligase family protein, partial [Pseudomonadota bacterium]
IAPILFRCWFLFSIPVLCGLSYIWAAYPSAALREAIFFFLSSFTVVIIGSLLTERQVLRAFFFCALVGTGLALSELSSIQARGASEFLGQKNYYAMKMMIAMIAAFAVAMNSKENPILRLIGIATVPIAFFLVTAANSATSLVLGSLALLLLIFGQAIWVNARNVRGLRTTIIGFTAAIAAASALAIISIFDIATVDGALELIGRDSTLTGRTALWDQAQRTSAEHPMLGVGAASFWQYDVGAAQSLALNDNRAAGTKLGFHNSYLEAQVHLGWIGLGLLCVLVAITMWKAIRGFIVDATFERMCFFVAALVIFGMSFTESIIFAYFHPGVYIFHLAAITAIATRYRTKSVVVRLVPEASGVRA